MILFWSMVYLSGCIVCWIFVAIWNDRELDKNEKLAFFVCLLSWFFPLGFLFVMGAVGASIALNEKVKSIRLSYPSIDELEWVKRWKARRKRGANLTKDLGIGD